MDDFQGAPRPQDSILLQIPPETLLAIVAFLPADSVRALCLACRALLPYGRIELLRCINLETSYAQVEQCLTFILADAPTRTPLIRHLAITNIAAGSSGWHYGVPALDAGLPPSAPLPPIPYGAALLAVVERAQNLVSLELGYAERALEAEPRLAGALARLPSFTTLTFPKMLARACAALPSFRHLTYAHLWVGSTGDPAALLSGACATLEYLSLEAPRLTSFFAGASTWPRVRTLNIRTRHLITPANLMRAFPALRRLEMGAELCTDDPLYTAAHAQRRVDAAAAARAPWPHLAHLASDPRELAAWAPATRVHRLTVMDVRGELGGAGAAPAPDAEARVRAVVAGVCPAALAVPHCPAFRGGGLAGLRRAAPELVALALGRVYNTDASLPAFLVQLQELARLDTLEYLQIGMTAPWAAAWCAKNSVVRLAFATRVLCTVPSLRVLTLAGPDGGVAACYVPTSAGAGTGGGEADRAALAIGEGWRWHLHYMGEDEI